MSSQHGNTFDASTAANETEDLPRHYRQKLKVLWRWILFSAGAVVLFSFLLILVSGSINDSALAAQDVAEKIVLGPKLVSLMPSSDCHTFELLEHGSDFLGRRDVPASLGWIESGFIGKDKVAMPDFTFGGVKNVAVGGYVEKTPLKDATTGETIDLVNPWYTHPREEGGYVLLDTRGGETSHVLYVNAHGKVERTVPTGGFPVRYGNRKGKVHLTDVTRMIPHRDGLVASADFVLRKEPTDWWRAMGYLDSASNTFYPFEIEDGLSERERREKSRDLKEKYYSRDFMFLALIESTTYLLVMDKVPWIGAVSVEAPEKDDLLVRRLADVPEDFSPLPNMKVNTDFRHHLEAVKGVYSIYQTVERSSMPVGIYAWQERLFLLVKGGADPYDGRTDWHLIEVSPVDGRERDRIKLPTQAEQISLARGNDFIGIIEKGPIGVLDSFPLRALYRPARSMTLAHESWLLSGQCVEHKALCQHYTVAD